MIREKFDILLQEFLKYIPELRQKDKKRLFDWGQKLAIYNRQKGRCKGCNKHVENIKEVELHHIQHYEKGGTTTVKNGEMYHPE